MTTQLTAAGNSAQQPEPPAFELFRNRVTESYAGLGEPGLPIFTGWLSGQPEDQHLSELAAEVVRAEENLLSTRSRIQDLLSDRRHSEDQGDGLLFSNSTAALGGLPRLLGRLAGERVRANLIWLARLTILASRAALSAEESEPDVRHDAALIRRDLFTYHDSGAVPREGEGRMSEREAAQQHTLLRRYLDVLQPHTEAGQRARETAVTCSIRSRFYDPAGDASRLDLATPASWEKAMQAAAVQEQKDAEKEIARYGK